MLIRERDAILLVASVDGHRLVLPDRQLGELAVIDLPFERSQVDCLGILAVWVDEFVEQERARNNQQPEDDLSSSRTQSLQSLRSRSYLMSALLVAPISQEKPLQEKERLRFSRQIGCGFMMPRNN